MNQFDLNKLWGIYIDSSNKRIVIMPIPKLGFSINWGPQLRCLFGNHDWEVKQGNIEVQCVGTVVLAFKVCRRCAKSKLIHLLT